MEFRQLKYFLAVADTGSVSKAATRLFIAQSALSQQVVLLEGDLGVGLFHRSSRGVSLTEAGQVFYEHAQTIMRQIEDARVAALQQLSESPAGTVVLGIPQSASAALAMPLLQAVRKQLPRVTLKLTEELTGNLIEQLKQGRLNLAILFDDGQLNEFARKRIVEEELYLLSYRQPEQPKMGQRITAKEALKRPLILPSIQHGVRQRVEMAAAEHGHVIESLVAEINSINIIKGAILADIGATILPLAPFQLELDQGLVTAQEIHEPSITRTISICTSRNVSITKGTAAVSRLIVHVVRDLCSSGAWPGATPIFHDYSNMHSIGNC